MSGKRSLFWGSLSLLTLYELAVQAGEYQARHRLFAAARAYCRAIGKPLLRIGMRRSPLEPPNGDYTVDIDSTVALVGGGVWADERCLPFADRQFGVCFNEHTLEHLPAPADVQLAVAECSRVADVCILLLPSSPLSRWAHETHRLLIDIKPAQPTSGGWLEVRPRHRPWERPWPVELSANTLALSTLPPGADATELIKRCIG